MKAAWAAVFGYVAMSAASAQTHVVKNQETVVRAVGVYEWTGPEAKPTASRFVPVTLFIDGHLEDAAVYLARPVPFALQSGTIFEMEHAGVPQGTLELSFARHMVSAGDVPLDDGWLGFGAFKPLVKPKVVASTLRPGPITQVEVIGGKGRPSFSNQPAATKSASTKPGETKAGAAKPGAAPSTSTTTDNSVDPDRPTLTRKAGNPADAATPPASTADSATASTDTDPDRPTMKRKTDSDSAPATGTADQTKPPPPDADPDRPTMKRPAADSTKPATDEDRAPEADPDRPTLRRRSESQRQAARKEHDSSSVIGGNTSLNDDPDRPSLHRGKPAGALDEGDLPLLQGLPAGLSRAVGVSDAARRPEHDFARPWEDDAERAAVLGKLQDAARSRLAGYVTSGAAAVPSSSAAAPSAIHPVPRTASLAQRKAAAAKANAASRSNAPAAFTDEKLRGYTLSYGGAATYVYSATIAAPEGSPRYVSLVAQREPNGDLKVALSNVTDASHLDRTPRFVLVDAVDAEASNRASLLFELRAQNTRQFALYRVIGAQAQQTFVSGSTQ